MIVFLLRSGTLKLGCHQSLGLSLVKRVPQRVGCFNVVSRVFASYLTLDCPQTEPTLRQQVVLFKFIIAIQTLASICLQTSLHFRSDDREKTADDECLK